MHYIVIPNPVAIINQKTGRPVLTKDTPEEEPRALVISMDDFITNYVLGNPQLSAGGGKGLRRVKKLMESFDNTKTGDLVGIENADYEIVRRIVDTIDWAGHPFAPFAYQLLPLFEAIEAAQSQDEGWKRRHQVSVVKDEETA